MKKPSGKNISNNKDAKNSGNKILLENKPRKRRHSLKLKDFKVSSPAESKILSILCDNNIKWYITIVCAVSVI